LQEIDNIKAINNALNTQQAKQDYINNFKGKLPEIRTSILEDKNQGIIIPAKFVQ